MYQDQHYIHLLSLKALYRIPENRHQRAPVSLKYRVSAPTTPYVTDSSASNRRYRNTAMLFPVTSQKRNVIDRQMDIQTYRCTDGRGVFQNLLSQIFSAAVDKNGLIKPLSDLLRYNKTRTNPYWPESEWMVEQFNHTCLVMLSMFVNDQPKNWGKLLPFYDAIGPVFNTIQYNTYSGHSPDN